MSNPFPPLSEIKFTAVRSRGPGGQNVNKVSSSAKLSWDFNNSSQLSSWHKHRISTRLSSFINKSGLLFLRSDEFRDLERNKERCLEKLREMLKEAFHVEKARKATKPTYSSKQKRLESTRAQGGKKNNRKKVEY